jgi:uncharacterized protein
MTAAWLLDPVHEVTVFESAPVLGGHIRTLGANVDVSLPANLRLDAGVIEFERSRFPTVVRLFNDLGLDTRPIPGTTTLWTVDGQHHLSPGSAARGLLTVRQRLEALVDRFRLAHDARDFLARTDIPTEALAGQTLGDVLGTRPVDRWLALLTTYAYSIPYERVLAVPAELAVPMLRAFMFAEDWFALEGGAYSWVQRVVDRMRGTIHTAAQVAAVCRNDREVSLRMKDATVFVFDAVVFAVPPDQVLTLLEDADDAERRRFRPWRANHIQTVVHRDPGLYRRRGIAFATEFDVFELPGGQGGYNALLDELCDVHETSTHLGLAFGMDDELDPAHILHIQPHHTPDYTVDALQWRDEVRKTNGHRRTYHAGAWLGDGLHEGAVASGARVADLLGGRVLRA